MNNLQERIPIPNRIQGSSEDPSGFIYPTYRAAPTEADRHELPLKGSHQDGAYLSSAVGGCLSTLSFKDTTSKNRLSSQRRRGGGTRGKVRGFSRASRRNLLRRLASIDRGAFGASKGRMVFVTLTYPHGYPDDPVLRKAHLKALRKRLQREVWGLRRLLEIGRAGEGRLALPLATVRGERLSDR
jgi:hypothetical protein